MGSHARLPTMNIALRTARMTRDQFFEWAERHEGRWEFDGFEPVAMTGDTINHSQICGNLLVALRTRVQGKGCRPLGPDAGLATIGDTVRYPDALVTCSKVEGNARVVPGVVVVFEVLSPSNNRTGRIVKLREYRAVSSIRRYVIVEHASVDLTVYARSGADEDWTATALTVEEILHMPEIGIEIPIAELYEDVDLSTDSGNPTSS